MRYLSLIALAAAIAGCSRPEPATNDVAMDRNSASTPNEQPAAVASPTNAVAAAVGPVTYSGRWRGVEGMYLVVTPLDGAAVSLEMQWDLDHKGSFPGVVTADGIRFTRDGRSELLRRTDGDATGLKYLAGKKDCLTVRSGEGYCRG